MGYQKILVPLDGSKLAEGVLRQIKTMAAPKAHVHLIHVAGSAHNDQGIGAAEQQSPMADSWIANPDLDAPESIEACEMYLRRAGETLTLDGYWVTVAVRHGAIADAIIEEAKNGNFDVIAAARHSRVGSGPLVLGSVTQAILAKAHCAVLVLPPVKSAATATQTAPQADAGANAARTS